MFTNKHVVIAMIVAPVLALLAWFAVGQLLGDNPQKALAGQSYPLVEKSNCRYASGTCDLENAEFRLRLSLEQLPTGLNLLLTSSHALQGVLLAVGEPDSESVPTMMRTSDGQGLHWRLAIARVPASDERIKLIARAGGSSYFAEASTLFMAGPETP
jgi:hypothetical protein